MPHPVATSGFSTDPDRYERGRPGYPIEAIDWMRSTLAVPGGTLDLGAGTGKLTRLLGGWPRPLVALDPVRPMLTMTRSTAPSAHLVLGAAERLPIGDGVLAAVVSAQAFHWFDAGLAWSELGRVLRPRGIVGLVANVRLRETEWIARLWSLMDELETVAPWRQRSASSRPGPRIMFEAIGKRSFRHAVPMTEDEVVDRMLSVSHVAVLGQEERRQVTQQVRAIVDEAPRPLQITYRTDVVVHRRT